MTQRSKLSGLALIIIGIVAGALFFSQINESTQPQVYSSPEPPQTSTPQADSVAPADRPISTLREFNQAFVDIAKSVKPSVVTVFTERVFKVRRHPFFGGPFEDFFEDFFGQRRRNPEEQEFRQRGLGSGVIVSKDGYILTNNHVIQKADTINVRLLDGRTFPAEVVGVDPKTDLALLRVDADNLPVIQLGNSDELQVGEWVMAIGSPLSPNLAHSVTRGMVSAKGRSNVGIADYEDFIQTDAAINPGNSGGALINLDGELIGINTAIASRTGGFQGIGFAVPVNMVRSVMESLIKHGKVIRGWLGIYIQDINENLAKAMDLPGTEGALVADVVEDSPAEEAGLQEEDVILELNGKKIPNTADLRNNIASTPPGTEVTLTIFRDGESKKVQVTLGKLEPESPSPKVEQKLQDLFGFSVAPFDQQMAQQYNLDQSLKGVVVTGVEPGSKAARAGLNEGDLVVAVNRKKAENMRQFNELVGELEKGDTVFLRVIRGNRSFFVAFTL